MAQYLDVLHPQAPILTVTGSNGKGSAVACLQAILLEKGYALGSFSSPYLERFQEQICLNGQAVSEEVLLTAFETIEKARCDCSKPALVLTEFEFLTLAALLIFKAHALDFIVLEVGLGGGKDAVNVIDSNLLIFTSLALEHEAYLGHTLEAIAKSEAGLLRPGCPVLLGFDSPPDSFLKRAAAQGCPVLSASVSFSEWEGGSCAPLAQAFRLALSACAYFHISLSPAEMQQAWARIHLKGRQQWVEGAPPWLLDVAHNPEALLFLSKTLQRLRHQNLPGRAPIQKVIAVFSMLKDKKIEEAIACLKPWVDFWVIAPIHHPRGADLSALKAACIKNGLGPNQMYSAQSLGEACQKAKEKAGAQDLILAVGSFHVVREALSCL